MRCACAAKVTVVVVSVCLSVCPYPNISLHEPWIAPQTVPGIQRREGINFYDFVAKYEFRVTYCPPLEICNYRLHTRWLATAVLQPLKIPRKNRLCWYILWSGLWACGTVYVGVGIYICRVENWSVYRDHINYCDWDTLHFLSPSPSLTLPPSQLRIRQTEQGNSDTSQRVEVACGAPPVRSVGHRHNGPCSRVQGNGDNSRRPVQTKRALFHVIKPSLWLSGWGELGFIQSHNTGRLA